jgi:hypothetical protein
LNTLDAWQRRNLELNIGENVKEAALFLQVSETTT